MLLLPGKKVTFSHVPKHYYKENFMRILLPSYVRQTDDLVVEWESWKAFNSSVERR